MADFLPVSGKVPQVIDKSVLQNQDTHNLFGLCNLLQNGASDDRFKKYFACKPGTVTASRWLTTANNIMCLYAQEENPSDQLKLLVQIILNIYAPTIFSIKMEWHISKASVHFFNILQASRDLLLINHPGLFQLVTKVLQNNPYNAHGETLLLSMLYDPDYNQTAVEKIQELRATMDETKVRQYEKPKVNFNAEHYSELLNSDQFTSPPPLVQAYDVSDLKELNFDPQFQQLQCMNQNVERIVYLTSQASDNAIGYENRHHWLINKEISAEKIPTEFNKQHFIDLLQT